MNDKTPFLEQGVLPNVNYMQDLLTMWKARPQASCFDCVHQAARYAGHGAPACACVLKAAPGRKGCRFWPGRRGCEDAHLYASWQGGGHD